MPAERSGERRAEQRYLAAIHEVLTRQRHAIVGWDVAAVNAATEKLLELFAAMQSEIEPGSATARRDGTGLRELAETVGRQIKINSFLLGSGQLRADHLVRCMASGVQEGEPFRLSGTA